jgi:DNA-binding GntR family transcriptional regulator
MSPGLTMERVYDALRYRLVHGELPPGARLDPGRLAEDLNASATPVRDALHRLLGERLVDARPQEGFRVPLLSEAVLRDLHGWSLDLLAASLRPALPSLAPARPRAIGTNAETDPAERIADLFDAIADGSGNDEHRRAVANLNARLHPFRRTEPMLITDIDAEYDALRQSWNGAGHGPLRRQLTAWHRRRVTLVPQIAALMRARAMESSQTMRDQTIRQNDE